MSEKEALPDGCTREKLFPVPTDGSNSRRRGSELSEACRKLLEDAARRLMKQRDGGTQGRTQELLREYQSDLFCCLMSLYQAEKKSRSERKTLTEALSSSKELVRRFLSWRKDNSAGHSPGSLKTGDPLLAFGENWDTAHYRRRTYYRKRFRRTLHDKGRIVQSVGEDCFFTYGSRDLDCLSRNDFQKRLGEIASSFKPDLSDQDFWQGEEPIYNNGQTGKHEGPGMKELDTFCEQLFRHVGTLFGHPYLLSLSMILDILPQCYTYFEGKMPLAISPSPGEDDKVPGEIAEQNIPGKRTWEAEKLRLCSFCENNRERIKSAVRLLDLKEAIILSGSHIGMSLSDMCRLIGQKSSGRMLEKCHKAFQKLLAILKGDDLYPDMYRFCDSDEGAEALKEYYYIKIFSFVWREWKADIAHLPGIDALQEAEKWD